MGSSTRSLLLLLLTFCLASVTLAGSFSLAKVGTTVTSSALSDLGSSVLYAGGNVYVGSLADNEVLIYTCTASCTQTKNLTGNPGDQFGTAIALVGNLLLVGAPGNASFYLYNSTNSFAPLGQIFDPSSSTSSLFGTTLALISSGTVLVGAPGSSSSNGVVYTYSCSSTTCSYASNATAPTKANGDLFGSSIAIDSSTTNAIIGAPGNAVAHLFSLTGNTLSFITNVTGTAGANFSSSVAASSSLFAVGSPSASPFGLVYVYSCNTTTCILVTTLSTSDNNFGNALSMSGSLLIVSADQKSSSTGGVYLYYCNSAGCTQDGSLLGESSGDLFGSSVSLVSSNLFIGASGKSGNGSFYYFSKLKLLMFSFFVAVVVVFILTCRFLLLLL